MGLISNQWLKGRVKRHRGHFPIGVSVLAKPSTGRWSTEHKVVANVQMTRRTGDYQSIYFTQEDLAHSLPMLASLAADATRRKVAAHALQDLDDSDLVQLLAEVLAKRAKRRE